jgi:alkanesulfonate monooxygenase SsuD/methylene tetrahydromethanopterin reductase-like flavin-dependent oxidoreductase (luciferase family)
MGQMIATLDVLSAGRAMCGLGVGWDRAEHESYGLRFPPTAERYDLLLDTLEVLPLLWGKGSPAYRGRLITAAELACYPRPIQDHIPIMIGGSGEQRTLRVVAEHADACNLFGRPEVVAGKVDVLRAHCHEVGRESGEIEVSHLLSALAASTRGSLRDRVERLRPRSTSLEQYAERHNAGLVADVARLVSRYHRAGATHTIVSIPDVWDEGSVTAFGEVIAMFR